MQKSIPQALLRRVETHVRVMSFPENFEHTNVNGENAITIRPPADGGADGTSSSSSAAYQQSFRGFTRVHANYTTSLDNELFYQDTLRKIVPAALAGQSFTVLFCGAPGSGRSQTMYTIDGRRDGGSITYGMLHYLAQDLLRAPNCRVLVSAFNVREKRVFDTMGGAGGGGDKREVPVRNMHSPLGAMPECTSILLEKPEDAMIVPNHKYKDGSCFVQFEVYHQMGVTGAAAPGGSTPPPVGTPTQTGASPQFGEDAAMQQQQQMLQQQQRKGAFSLITFVDVAQFDMPLPRDVSSLRGSIERHLAGSDPQFGACRLSELLEASVCRGRSLIGIATVIGQPQIFPHTAAALGFVELLGRIEQVASLCQFVHPKWLQDLPAKLQQLDAMHDERCRRHYDRGFGEVYHAFRNAFVAKLEEVERHMAANSQSGPSAELAQLRADLKAKLDVALTQLEAAARDEERRIERNLAAVDRLREANERDARAVQADGDMMQARRHEMHLERSRAEKQQAEVSRELAIHDEARRRHVRAMEELQRGIDAEQVAMRDAKKNCLRVQDRLHMHLSTHMYETALAKLMTQKEHLQAQLTDATARAINQDHTQRTERQRKTANFLSTGGAGGGGALSSNGAGHHGSTGAIPTSSQGSVRLGSQQQQLSTGRHQSGQRRERVEDDVHHHQQQQQQQPSQFATQAGGL